MTIFRSYGLLRAKTCVAFVFSLVHRHRSPKLYITSFFRSVTTLRNINLYLPTYLLSLVETLPAALSK